METLLSCLFSPEKMEPLFSCFFLTGEDDPIPPSNELLEELISDILSRLPVKTLLRFTTVSKPWLSLISHPSFATQHLRRTTTTATALFISAYDHATTKRHLLSAPHGGAAGGGSVTVTHLMTLHNTPTISRKETTEAEHLNGLILFTSGNGFIVNNFAFVVNPATRKFFKLPGPASESNHTYGKVHICYFFGFDESRNEHKILTVRMLDIRSLTPFKPTVIEVMIFSMSNHAWRTIDVDLPFDVSGDCWYYGTKHSVCVNSVIHIMLQSRNEILEFDLRTEKFSINNMPQDAVPRETHKRYYKKGLNTVKSNQPILMKINGFLGVICHDRVVECDEMDVWILRDHVDRVWVRETVVFSKSWFILDGPFPLNPVLRRVVVLKRPLTRVEINVPMYDMETRSVEPVKYMLDHEFLHSNTLRFDHVRSYVESIFPLER